MGIEDVKEKLSIVFKAIVLTSVILLSYFAGHAFSSLFRFQNSYISGMWCAVTAVVVFDDLPANAKNIFRDRALGTLVGAILGGAAVSMLGHLFFSICLALFVVCIIITLFKWHGALKIACITVLIVNFTTIEYSIGEIWISSAMRFIEGMIGGTISLLATLLIDKGRKKGFFLRQEENTSTS